MLDRDGSRTPVEFGCGLGLDEPIPAQVVQAATKWKRVALRQFGCRVGEGINMTFASGLMFPINSAALSDGYKDDLSAAAAVFAKYPDTNILVEGHTDDTGTEQINMDLSQRRAKTVSDFLVANGVSRSRLQTKAYGQAMPKYPNDSEANRSKNRRVELAVYANDDMKANAQAGNL